MGRNQRASCIHRWVLGEPQYGTVDGTCRRCGARRSYPSGPEFPEAVPDYEELADSSPMFARGATLLEEHALV